MSWDYDFLLTASFHYKPSIEAFKTWCERTGRSVPAEMRPAWIEETYEVRVDNGTPIPARVIAWINPIYWVIRTASDIPAFAFDRIETRTQHVLTSDSYLKLPLRMYTVRVFDPAHPSDDPFYHLKHVLSTGSPVVLSITTFAKYRINKDTKERIKEKQWLTEDAKPSNGYIIGMPPVAKEGCLPGPEDYEVEGGHAICVCAYDDARNAIRFKNKLGYRICRSWICLAVLCVCAKIW